MNDKPLPPGSVQAIAELAARALEERHNQGRPFVIVPEGCRLEYPAEPSEVKRLHGWPQLQDMGSFIAYVQRMDPIASRCGYTPLAYLDADKLVLTCVFDETSEGLPDGEVMPGPHVWRASWQLRTHRLWDDWIGKNRQPMGQLDFARFLEDHLQQLVDPPGAALLELALQFEAARDQTFRSDVRLQDGSTRFTWIDQERNREHNTQMPRTIELALPVFRGDEPASVGARLKYRVREQKLVLWYELDDPEQVLEDRLARIEDEVSKALVAHDILVLRGAP